MDILGFLCLRAWDAQREQEKKKPRQRFIDEVWPGGEAVAYYASETGTIFTVRPKG